jgi:hypothetical protein
MPLGLRRVTSGDGHGGRLARERGEQLCSAGLSQVGLTPALSQRWNARGSRPETALAQTCSVPVPAGCADHDLEGGCGDEGEHGQAGQGGQEALDEGGHWGELQEWGVGLSPWHPHSGARRSTAPGTTGLKLTAAPPDKRGHAASPITGAEPARACRR